MLGRVAAGHFFIAGSRQLAVGSWPLAVGRWPLAVPPPNHAQPQFVIPNEALRAEEESGQSRRLLDAVRLDLCGRVRVRIENSKLQTANCRLPGLKSRGAEGKCRRTPSQHPLLCPFAPLPFARSWSSPTRPNAGCWDCHGEAGCPHPPRCHSREARSPTRSTLLSS